jgi:DNA repair protein RadC
VKDACVKGSWQHPGGKLRELGPESLSDTELLAILISTGIPGKSAEQIANEVMSEYGSLKGLSGRPLEELLRFKGLSDVKIIRIAAAMEIARRFGKF